MTGIKVTLKEDFSVVRETLERMGIRNNKTKNFYPSCYCVETKEEGVYKIVHFKELFPYVNRETTFNDEDLIRLKTITHLLDSWGIVELIDDIDEIMTEKITVLPHSEKRNYNIVHKFKFIKKIIIN